MIEQSWTTSAGYPAIATLSDYGYRCGYIGLPKSHSLYGIWAEGTDVTYTDGQKPKALFTVHGGITYSGNSHGGIALVGEHHASIDAPTDPAYWWIGFDCSHFDPLNDGRTPEFLATQPKPVKDKFAGAELRPLAYVVAQCESLANQISAKESSLTLAQKQEVYSRKTVYLDNLVDFAPQ